MHETESHSFTPAPDTTNNAFRMQANKCSKSEFEWVIIYRDNS